MTLSMILKGLTLFQNKLAKFITKTEEANKVDTTRIESIQSKIDERDQEIVIARRMQKGVVSLLAEDE